MDTSRTAIVPGRVHHLAQPQFDRGAADPARQMSYMVLLVKPSAAQQGDLDSLLFDQQNPSSPSFRKWLTPDQFAGRFGLNLSDRSKLVAWLTSQGFAVDHLARSANWIAFSGTAAQVTSAFQTPIHQFQVNGQMHFANTLAPSVPEAFSDVIGGFLGLNDFHPESNAKLVSNYNIGSSHYLAPADFATIYDVAPLYAAGIDGTGQSIAVVGESDVLASDISAFRVRYGLPVNNPQMILYGSPDPGFNGAQIEGNLDLEWSGAIAPKATIYYVYGQDPFTAVLVAVERNYAPVITISYGYCEVDFSPGYYRSVAQQGNAQGITILAASGDAGAAACDTQGEEPFATRGKSVQFPAALPEVTGVGGTQFVEGTGTYWGTTNSSTFGSVLSYIPEAAWNESAAIGLLSGGGGASTLYPKPLWQTGPGVPADNVRDVPDIALSAALHDAYEIYYAGSNGGVAGTSCAAPSMAGIVALLNQYQVTNKFQTKPGLGNINPQLYRLAQKVPSAFHDVMTGSNIVVCSQGSPDCGTGSFGYPAGVAYDQATGLGSVDANNLVTQWNTATNGSIVTLTSSVARATLNDTVQFTVTVTPATGTGTPTGTVNFVYYGTPLATATVSGGTATVSIPMYQPDAIGSVTITAEYSGDASFSSGSATKTVVTTIPSGVASLVTSAPSSVWPSPADAQGLSWQTTISLFETAGVPAIVTGLTIDGVSQTLSQYFPAPQIPPSGSISANFVFRGLAAPVTKTFVFTGTDPTGLSWTRQVAITFMALPTYDYFNLSATPLTAVQNPASATCPWSVQLNIDDLGGFGVNLITGLLVGQVDMSASIASIFGTTQLDAYDGLQGTICFSAINPPATDTIDVALSGGNSFNVAISFAGPPANPGTLSATPGTVSLAAPQLPLGVGTAVKPTATVAVNLSDKTQQWTASIYPANRTTSWLAASQLSGTGSGTITLTANSTGFEPGAYRATVVLQSQNSVPQYVNVPVMFVLGGSATSPSITAIANAASYQTPISPGMLATVLGTGLANSTVTASGNPLSYSTAGLSVTVNGLAAPVLYASPTQLNIQIPYTAGAGPAVLGINNNGQIAGLAFQISPTSPGIFSDGSGNVVPTPTVHQGGVFAFYVTGTGDNSPAIQTAFSPSSGTRLANLPRPLGPVSVTVGGVPAFLEFIGITPGLIGVTQINVLVPSSVPAGNQPLVVTVGGASSIPVNLVVQP